MCPAWLGDASPWETLAACGQTSPTQIPCGRDSVWPALGPRALEPLLASDP